VASHSATIVVGEDAEEHGRHRQSSPEPWHAVRVEGRVGGDKCQALEQRRRGDERSNGSLRCSGRVVSGSI
jgi:hypothetical protein